MVRSAFSASFLIVAGTFGWFVANASWTLTSPLSIWTDFTRPNETISRVKTGYFTDFKALFTCSSEIVMPELTRAGLEVNRVVRFSDRFWGAQAASLQRSAACRTHRRAIHSVRSTIVRCKLPPTTG